MSDSILCTTFDPRGRRTIWTILGSNPVKQHSKQARCPLCQWLSGEIGPYPYNKILRWKCWPRVWGISGNFPHCLQCEKRSEQIEADAKLVEFLADRMSSWSKSNRLKPSFRKLVETFWGCISFDWMLWLVKFADLICRSNWFDQFFCQSVRKSIRCVPTERNRERERERVVTSDTENRLLLNHSEKKFFVHKIAKHFFAAKWK